MRLPGDKTPPQFRALRWDYGTWLAARPLPHMATRELFPRERCAHRPLPSAGGRSSGFRQLGAHSMSPLSPPTTRVAHRIALICAPAPVALAAAWIYVFFRFGSTSKAHFASSDKQLPQAIQTIASCALAIRRSGFRKLHTPIYAYLCLFLLISSMSSLFFRSVSL